MNTIQLNSGESEKKSFCSRLRDFILKIRRKYFNLSEEKLVIDNFSGKLVGWTKNASSGLVMNYTLDKEITRGRRKSLKLEYIFEEKKPFIGYLEKTLTGELSWQGYNAISIWSYIPVAAQDLVELSIMLYEQDGSAYIAQHVRSLKTEGWKEIKVSFDKFYPAGEWTTDENNMLDLNQINKMSIGIFQPNSFKDQKFTIYFNNIIITKDENIDGSGNEEIIIRQNDLQKYEPVDDNVYHGLFAFTAPLKGWGKEVSDWEDQIDINEIIAYETDAGREATILSFVWFLDWDFPTAMCQRIYEMGRTPHIGITSGQLKPSVIIDGIADDHIANWAKAAKKYGKPVFFRYMAEMNGNWNSYSEAFDPAQTHEKYIEAWQRVVDIFRKEGAENIIWVWSPTAIDVGNIHWADYYPGDDYVDWVGISVYSFLGNGDPESLILDIYNDYAARKPIMIAECGAGDADGDSTTYNPGENYSDNPEKWINRFFDTIEGKAPRVKAFVWFNIDRERVWKIQESPTKIEIFKNRLSNNRYNAKVR